MIKKVLLTLVLCLMYRQHVPWHLYPFGGPPALNYHILNPSLTNPIQPSSVCGTPGCNIGYVPVCGSRNMTYKNECVMRCVYSDTLQYRGVCSTTNVACTCSNISVPVCGVNGQTYINSCHLLCARMTREYSGACRTTPFPIPTPPNCTCPPDYRPVCGMNGKTYGNLCLMACDGTNFQKEGNCHSCVCGTEYSPVCGVNNIEYANACRANCAGVSYKNGICPKNCSHCHLNLDPVCASNGKTYYNSCYASCNGQISWETGSCESTINCDCYESNDPVCGLNGITYMNDCFASCYGQKSWKEGSCKPFYYQEPVIQHNTIINVNPFTDSDFIQRNPFDDSNCVCPDKVEVMCGSDGKIYGNECLLRCAGTDIDYTGKCFK